MSQQFWPNSQPYQSSQPSYAYRDQSLYYSADGLDYLYAGRRRQFHLLRLFVKVFFLLCIIGGALLLPMHDASVYSTYKQGTCTITNKQVREKVSRNKRGQITSRKYYPLLSYTVHPSSGGEATATGFEGPEQTNYSFHSDAQALADRYQIGETTACWYNPAEPDKAFILFRGYGWSDANGTFLLSLAGFAGLAIAVYLLFDWTAWRLYALYKRGVVTQGIVLRNEERRSRARRYIVSIVSFRALEESGKERTITVRQMLAVGSLVPVCYDPFYPRYRRYGEWPNAGASMPGLLGIGGLLLIAFFIMVALWLVP